MEVLERFLVDGGRLYRKRWDGTVRQVQTVEDGRLVTVLKGRKYYGPDLAWACHYRVVPMFPVVTIDTDPFNLSVENLGAARVRRLVCRIRSVKGGYLHPLSTLPFRTYDEAKQDWVSRARAIYADDLPYVLQLQGPGMPQAPSEAVVRARLRVVHTRKRPPDVPGMKWYWYREQWVSLPPAVHQSDDWQVRADALLADAGARAVFDPLAGKTLYASAATPVTS